MSVSVCVCERESVCERVCVCELYVSQMWALRLRGGADESHLQSAALSQINALGHVREYVRNFEIDYEFLTDDGKVTTAVTYELCDSCWHPMTPIVARSLQLATEKFSGAAPPELIRIIVDDWNKLMIREWRWRQTRGWIHSLFPWTF